MTKTLYLSDLDGTLLHSDSSISAYTADTINRLHATGLLFSYATARSHLSASAMTKSIHAPLPVITYTGTFIVDHATGARLHASFFQPGDVRELLGLLTENSVHPIVYTITGGREVFMSLTGQLNAETAAFVRERQHDQRNMPVDHPNALLQGDTFFFTCIDAESRLEPLYHTLKNRFSCVYGRDYYTGDCWLEIMPPGVSKAQAALKLKELLHCDRIVAFGDGINDIPLFEVADACYAVENAVDALKSIATGIIGSNDADDVAAWLDVNAAPR